MIQIAPQMRILVAIEPVDFRKGIDGLARICREVIRSDPFSGTLFVFRNRSAKSVKLLVYDGQGYWLAQKRLSRGRFVWWPEAELTGGAHRELAAHEIQILLWSGDPEGSRIPAEWKRIERAGQGGDLSDILTGHTP